MFAWLKTVPKQKATEGEGFFLELDSLFASLSQLTDLRKPRGVRYPLPVILMVTILAKLAGANNLQEIAEWSQAHQSQLAALFGLNRTTMPHPTTFSRVLGNKLIVAQLEQLLQAHFQPKLSDQVPARGSLTVSIDGKTMRGTIPSGLTSGVHLMAAYLPAEKLVLTQVEVGSKTNEITAAPTLVKQLDLRGMVVTGDAMQAQRGLSTQIVGDGGDFLWLVKANQKGLLGEIAQLFEPVDWGQGFSPPPLAVQTHTTYSHGHARSEKRTIWVSQELTGYAYWPHLGQVFKLEREWLEWSNDDIKSEVRYGITSLPATVAGPDRLLEIARQEWGIENSLHYVRDVTLGEDACQVRRGKAPQVLAALNNTVLNLLRSQGATNIAKARRAWNYAFTTFLFQFQLGSPVAA
jgi:predicted transposase YbfD/YdcC